MNRLIISLLILCLMSCNSAPKKIITEDQAISVLKGFFTALDIDNLGKELVYDFTTSDFVIYEMGEKYDLPSFLNVIKTHFKKGYISTDWSLYDFKVSIDDNTAHISYFNKGKFIFIEKGVKKEENIVWMESVYLKYEDEELKLSFLQSDDISREFIQADSK
ncbi:MAG: hypothetical protein OR998_03355 [Flavobacteriaceae bacterium]|nr:hypothetical protein [Flavobacteriaceae bacterium]